MFECFSLQGCEEKNQIVCWEISELEDAVNLILLLWIYCMKFRAGMTSSYLGSFHLCSVLTLIVGK